MVPARLPDIRIVANRDTYAVEGIGTPLMAALATRLDRGEQSLVFINRRGREREGIVADGTEYRKLVQELA